MQGMAHLFLKTRVHGSTSKRERGITPLIQTFDSSM